MSFLFAFLLPGPAVVATPFQHPRRPSATQQAWKSAPRGGGFSFSQPPASQPCPLLDQQSSEGALASTEELGVESPELGTPPSHFSLRDTGLGKGPTACYRWGSGQQAEASQGRASHAPLPNSFPHLLPSLSPTAQDTHLRHGLRLLVCTSLWGRARLVGPGGSEMGSWGEVS